MFRIGLLSLLLVGCATTIPLGEPPLAPGTDGATGLVFFVEPADAQIVVNGREMGEVRALGEAGLLPLPPGTWEVALRREGFAPWRQTIEVGADVPVPVRVQLVPLLR